ncbi:AMP-binding protein [Marinobacter mangrovi]|uniref:AMP-binding protein n=1 Tax=Marinobacter mangrovi TaxID=2803918 RepID=UPI001932C844|nr:AMP-binding protein [Marinobacter mangrovi]
MRHRVELWFEALEGAPHGSRWVLYNPDPFEFSAQMLALWSRGLVACLPGDNLPGTQSELTGYAEGALGQWSNALELNAQAARPDNANTALPALDPDALAVEVFTSGSTGAPSIVPKHLRQLIAEMHTLETLFPVTGQPVVLSTVSHQHIYGFLFRILRPLCNGSLFERRLCHFMEDLLQLAGQYHDVILVSSPTHLKRLPDTAAWQGTHGRWQWAFSSAGPLAPEDSLRAQALLGTAIREIYGSSETGGIAWRVQAPDHSACWTPSPGMIFREGADGSTELRSPHLPSDDWMRLDDTLEWQAGSQFRLLGRTDRIVKVEGKRVAIAAMEQHLKARPEIAEARIVLLSGQRDALAAAVELTPDGQRQMATGGRRPLTQAFRAALAEHYEPVVLPRRWHLCESLPYDPQGKLPLVALQGLFTENSAIESPPEKPDQPVVHSNDHEGDQIRLDLHVPGNLIYFDGHFEQYPVLPGVVQVHWAQQFASRHFDVPGRFTSLEVIKFQQVILPDARLTLLLTYHREKGKVSFQYEAGNQRYSSGRICFASE